MTIHGSHLAPIWLRVSNTRVDINLTSTRSSQHHQLELAHCITINIVYKLKLIYA
ncbi:hypothetical protein M378DRAFT_162898 [Amanita muscaria Koide BX008]|uniref:Uncharacterized protein n=1 Tax=Amanita muscaria (strain Koide BX008) TaxID=946122 RepID=A0A0C2WSS0_AMAMK|nr:hypothetical protein M378DRAFT_162898 [Amanita muscaria Koide BX008]